MVFSFSPDVLAFGILPFMTPQSAVRSRSVSQHVLSAVFRGAVDRVAKQCIIKQQTTLPDESEEEKAGIFARFFWVPRSERRLVALHQLCCEMCPDFNRKRVLPHVHEGYLAISALFSHSRVLVASIPCSMWTPMCGFLPPVAAAAGGGIKPSGRRKGGGIMTNTAATDMMAASRPPLPRTPLLVELHPNEESDPPPMMRALLTMTKMYCRDGNQDAARSWLRGRLGQLEAIREAAATMLAVPRLLSECIAEDFMVPDEVVKAFGDAAAASTHDAGLVLASRTSLLDWESAVPGGAKGLKRAQRVLIADASCADASFPSCFFDSRKTPLLEMFVVTTCRDAPVNVPVWHGCGSQNLRSVALVDLPSLRLIESNAFANCEKLETFVLSELPNLVGIGACVLSGAGSLRNLSLSDLPGLRSIGDHFVSHCRSLVRLEIQRLSSLETIGENLACQCPVLRHVLLADLPALTHVGPRGPAAARPPLKFVRVPLFSGTETTGEQKSDPPPLIERRLSGGKRPREDNGDEDRR